MTNHSFKQLGLSQPWLENLDRLGYIQMTPIQADALPIMLQGKDVLAQAATGTGKTAAFGLALLSRATPAGRLPTALVLCPTRELAAQVAGELRRLARPLPNTNIQTLTGGSSLRQQRHSLKYGADVIVGTPGRLLDHLERETLDLSAINTLVLDEADRLLDMGFLHDVATIIEHTPQLRQTLLFSATTSEEVRDLGRRFQKDAAFLVAATDEVPLNITQLLYELGNTDRIDALRRLLAYYQPESAVIFCNQRDGVDNVTKMLRRAGHSVKALHGGMEQHQRDEVLLQFRLASLRLLVATNVAARGLDIDELDMVINYELPRDAKEFIHRVGRTGRAGEQGLAISLIGSTDTTEIEKINDITPASPSLASAERRPIKDLPLPGETPLLPPCKVLRILGGRKDKLRPGDIVGALTGELGIDNDAIGQIHIRARSAYVAIDQSQADRALKRINTGQIKGRRFRTQMIR